MLARRGSQILALTRRDAVRLVLLVGLLVAGLTFVLAFEDLSTMTLISDLVVLAGWFIFSAVLVSLLLAWLWRFRSRLWHRNNAITLIALTLSWSRSASSSPPEGPWRPSSCPPRPWACSSRSSSTPAWRSSSRRSWPPWPAS